MRRWATTNDVSRIGTASTSSGKNRVTIEAVLSRPCNGIVARTKPSRRAPESPMKIRAG